MSTAVIAQQPFAARLPKIGVILLYAIGLGAIVGFGVFRTWPHLLSSPGAMAFYPIAFTLFARVHVLVAFITLAVFLTIHVRGRWLVAFTLIYIVSLISELAGTTVGLPFGPYSYTDALGIKWFNHVPALIPLSWFFMALPSYALARPVDWPSGGTTAGRVMRVVRASLILVAWDLSLDPAMSGATSYWVWGAEGPYYGMPLLNLFGWFVTGLALMAILELMRSYRWVDGLSRRWMLWYYGANLFLPLGMNAAAGMWLAILVTVSALGLCWGMVHGERRLGVQYS